jgi:UDP-glucose 4-epimerase
MFRVGALSGGACQLQRSRSSNVDDRLRQKKREDPLAASYSPRKHVVAEVERLAGRERRDQPGLDEVEPSVDEPRPAPLLLDEAADSRVLVDLDNTLSPRRAGCVDRQRRRSPGAAVRVHDRQQRVIDEDVSVQDDEGRAGEVVERIANAAGGSEQRRLDDDGHLEPPSICLDVALDLIREVVRVHDHALHAFPFEVPQMAGQKRFAADVEQDLRRRAADVTEASAETGCEYHRARWRLSGWFRGRSRLQRKDYALARARAIVTGGAGFIGSHVADALVADGVETVVVDDLSTGRAELVAPEATFEQVDITDRHRFDAVADAVRPGVIFHLAAQSSVTVSVTNPVRDCEVNVQGTLNVLEAAKRHGAHVVFTSTGGALYGNEAPMPTPEERIPAPLAPYGASKWAGEAYVLTWSAATGTAHAVCRLGNIYGPRQSPHGEAGVVAIFSHHLWRGEAPTLFGFGRPTRDYVHVSDVVQAMLAAEGKAGVFNVSTGVETDVTTIFTLLQECAGTSVEPVLAPLRPGELERSCMDPGRARRELGWRAEVDLAAGLESTYRALVAEFEGRS